MVLLQHAALHILDVASGILVYSQKEMNLENPVTVGYLSKHLEKAESSTAARTGELHSNTRFEEASARYLAGEIGFIEYSTAIAEMTADALGRSSKAQPTDLLVCDYESENGRKIGLLLLYNKTSFSHYVSQEQDGVRNELIEYQALLPGPGQKIESYAIIDAQTRQVEFVDRKVEVDGQEMQIVPELIVECSSVVSAQETIKIVQKAATKIAEEHGGNPAEIISKAKTYLVENAESSDEISSWDLSSEIFAESPVMQHEFNQAMQEAGVPENVKVDREYAAKAGRTQKIKTDTGIEVSFPSDYFENRDFMEFIQNPDGTISIELKNINKITNK